MVKIFNSPFLKNTRLLFCGLVFFLSAIFSCQHRSKNIMVIWKDSSAVGISIPEDLIGGASSAIKDTSLKITVKGAGHQTGILGSYSQNNHSVVFESAVPLMPGLTYVVNQSGKQLGTVQVPFAKNEKRPKLLGIYPETDTLPENQLKLYLAFSKPMHRGQSLDYVKIVNSHGDTPQNVFLDLQPELWDTTGKVFTLWLDPGRIKRGLVLNQKLGNPLKKTEVYHLVVSMDWKDNRGMKLFKHYEKKFLAGDRQEKAPNVNSWTVSSPKAANVEPLTVKFPVPMDHYLLQESIQVVDDQNKPVKGTISTFDNDKVWQFVPQNKWQSKGYNLSVAGRLEDLAGNNLNRIFDRDIKKDKPASNQQFYKRVVRILP